MIVPKLSNFEMSIVKTLRVPKLTSNEPLE